jgi:hypothetical protein
MGRSMTEQDEPTLVKATADMSDADFDMHIAGRHPGMVPVNEDQHYREHSAHGNSYTHYHSPSRWQKQSAMGADIRYPDRAFVKPAISMTSGDDDDAF